MSQIDKVGYLPLLFWFIILFSLFYFFVFGYFLKYFLIAFNTRNRLFDELVTFSINCYTILSAVSFFLSINTTSFFKVLFVRANSYYLINSNYSRIRFFIKN